MRTRRPIPFVFLDAEKKDNIACLDVMAEFSEMEFREFSFLSLGVVSFGYRFIF